MMEEGREEELSSLNIKKVQHEELSQPSGSFQLFVPLCPVHTQVPKLLVLSQKEARHEDGD